MTFLKVIAGAALVPVLATSVLAHEGHKAHGGFSIGAQAGYVTGESKFDRRYVPAGSTLTYSSDLAGRGAVGGLSLAYGHVFSNHLFAGLEIKGEFSGLKGNLDERSINPAFAANELRMKDSFGAALKLGGVVNSVLPYVQLGVVSTKFESAHTSSIIGGALPPESFKASKRLTGFEAGVGIDVPVSERMTVGGKFLHTEYGTHSYSFKDSAAVVVGDFKVKPRTNAFMLTAKYRFW